MIRSIVMLIAVAALRSLANPIPGSAWLMTDGVEVYPSNTVATPAQVSQVEGTATEARGVAEAAAAMAAACASKVELFSSNYVVTSTVYVQSVGAVAYDPSNQTMRVIGLSATATNLVIVATVAQLPLVPPALDWRQTLGSGGAWSSVTATVQSVDVPEGATNAVAAYAFTLARPDGGSAYFRVVDNSTGASGSGLYWVVFGGLVVDGHKGASGTITNVVGSVTNFYRKVGGIIVEPEPLGGF
jgi:hypothetical protein